jgi:hypothetical protein
MAFSGIKYRAMNRPFSTIPVPDQRIDLVYLSLCAVSLNLRIKPRAGLFEGPD